MDAELGETEQIVILFSARNRRSGESSDGSAPDFTPLLEKESRQSDFVAT